MQHLTEAAARDSNAMRQIAYVHCYLVFLSAKAYLRIDYKAI